MKNEDPQTLASYSQTERQTWITTCILEQGAVQVEELAELFQVSRMTIHRDLDDLEMQGVLRKVRNGATALPSSLFESDLRFRMKQYQKEKEAMSRAALAYIETGQAIFLDEASTLLPLVHMLPALAPLTVITNFLPIMTEISAYKDIHLITLGGEYLPRFATFTGLLTERTMESLHAEVYITSTTAVFKGIAYHPDQQVVRVKKAMIAHSTRQILLLCHTKFGKTALHEVAPLSAFDRVIIDEGLSAENHSNLEAMGVKVDVAPLGD
ncbi:MAG: DeoR/GlpR family DNA-binding transcription regulator [Anaerolineae bacterium]|nr:DeoR/GlpR family DNA-binding transcription regulator [Anaerolineae bacterium]